MGSLRDMVQNHMLQLLALVAMEAPAQFTATAVRDEKVKVLRSLRKLDAARESVIGQYTAGAVAGQPVPGYMPRSSARHPTPRRSSRSRRMSTIGAGTACLSTCARASAARAQVGNRHPVQSGAALDVLGPRRDPASQPSWSSRSSRTRISACSIMAKQPGLDRGGIRLREVPLDIGLPNAFADVRRRIAYERLLLDLIEGDPTLFVRRDEVEAQWDWIDAIRAGWSDNGMTAKNSIRRAPGARPRQSH
jgi:glucose-6-phosphate 1-dehydrogenase